MVRTSLAVGEHADLVGFVVGDGPVRLTDLERDVLVLFAVQIVTERRAVDVGVDVHRGAWGVVVLGSPVRVLVVDPVPRADHRRVGGDDHAPFGVGLVRDGFVEVGDDDHADAERAAVLQQAAAGGLEVDRGLIARRHGGEAGRLARRHAGGARGEHRHRVGVAIAELLHRLPRRAVRRQDARDRLAAVADHRHVGERAAGGRHPDRACGVDVIGAGCGYDGQRGRLRRRGFRLGTRWNQGRGDDGAAARTPVDVATEHAAGDDGEDGEGGDQPGHAVTTRRQRNSQIFRHQPDDEHSS